MALTPPVVIDAGISVPPTPAGLFGFPNPVNEKAARVVAAGVVVMAAVIAVTGWWWLSVVMAVGFLARVLTGPKLSLLGQFATRVVAPRLGRPRLVPGPPKRFAQAIGLAFSVATAVLSLGLSLTVPATVVVSVLALFALLESALGFCAGCWVFGYLMRWGVIPEDTCQACADVSARWSA